MSCRYYKRYRMELDLRRAPAPISPPIGYDALPWTPELLESHADVKYRSFHREIDAEVFPCLGDPVGCLELMREISQSPDFLDGATWLAVCYRPGRPEFCGTIQGVCANGMCGSIQNIGVTVRHRGRGLGTFLLLKALEGFRAAGLISSSLEVTAANRDAVRLYQRLGFRHVKTLYKAPANSVP
jgi:GNAT superfamily N-acetyltransferase